MTKKKSEWFFGLSGKATFLISLVLGGLPITGGAKVRFSNIVIGTLMYAVLNSGLSILGYQPQVQQLIKGIVFLVFVALTIDRKALKVIK